LGGPLGDDHNKRKADFFGLTLFLAETSETLLTGEIRVNNSLAGQTLARDTVGRTIRFDRDRVNK